MRWKASFCFYGADVYQPRWLQRAQHRGSVDFVCFLSLVGAAFARAIHSITPTKLPNRLWLFDETASAKFILAGVLYFLCLLFKLLLMKGLRPYIPTNNTLKNVRHILEPAISLDGRFMMIYDLWIRVDSYDPMNNTYQHSQYFTVN